MKFNASFNCGMAEFRFDGKPSADVRAILKSYGFRWSPSGGYWWRRGVSGAADIAAAIEKQLHRESGKPDKPDGACWKCKSPDGFFRSVGATGAPVWCAACHAEYLKAKAAEESSRRGERAALDVDRLYEDSCARACGL